MTVVVPIVSNTTSTERATQRKRQMFRRSALVVCTMLLIGSIAAVPLPVWHASHDIANHADALRGWIDDARREEALVAKFRAANGESLALKTAAEVQRWLAPHDSLETRNLILKTARACGLTVTSADLTTDIAPLAAEAPGQSTTTVLGTALAPPASAPASVFGAPVPMQADRYVLSGTGGVSAVLLFCGVLHEMPAPLRLRSVRLDASDDTHRFIITIDKLRERTSAPSPATEPVLEPHDPQDA